MPTKVLIVEDDGNIAELLHLYLEKEGLIPRWPPTAGKRKGSNTKTARYAAHRAETPARRCRL